MSLEKEKKNTLLLREEKGFTNLPVRPPWHVNAGSGHVKFLIVSGFSRTSDIFIIFTALGDGNSSTFWPFCVYLVTIF